MMQSKLHISPEWRSGIEAFLADVWDITPDNRCHRYLALKEEERGYRLDNVEYHFEGLHGPGVSRAVFWKTRSEQRKKTRKARPRKVIFEERRAEEKLERMRKRAKLAEEFKRWEAMNAKRLLVG